MNYQQGVTYMIELASQSGSFEPYPGIIIHYPGKKPARGDYRLSLGNENGPAPTYSQISLMLHNLITSGTHNYKELTEFLIDVYENGTNTPYLSDSLERLKHLIYWVTLQEDINYPRGGRFAGINLAYCRFFEAIYSTQPHSVLSISDVQSRCNNHGSNRPPLLNIPNAPYFYNYSCK